MLRVMDTDGMDIDQGIIRSEKVIPPPGKSKTLNVNNVSGVPARSKQNVIQEGDCVFMIDEEILEEDKEKEGIRKIVRAALITLHEGDGGKVHDETPIVKRGEMIGFGWERQVRNHRN